MRSLWNTLGTWGFIVAVTLTAFPLRSEASASSQSNIMEPEAALEHWIRFENSTKEMTRGLVKMVMSFLMKDSSEPLNVTSECSSQVLKLMAGLRNIKPWAFSLIDASAKMMEGMMTGTMSNLGEYDQCINTEAIQERSGKHRGKVMFRGKYCALDIKPPLPPKRKYYKLNEVIKELGNFSKGGTVISEAAKSAHLFYLVAMRMGICVPSGCQESDIAQITDRISAVSGFFLTVNRCEIKEDKMYTPVIVGVMCLFSFFGFLLAIGTIIDVFFHYTKRKAKSICMEVLLTFSFVSNFKRFVKVNTEPNPLSCFSGLRVLSITWIILGHTYLNINLMTFRGLKTAMEFPNDFAFQAVINATVAVDTFFFMGGALVCYLVVKIRKEVNKPFNVGLYIFHRVFRIWPIYAMVVAFMFLSPLLGRGPIWEDVAAPFTYSCNRNWWANLLFINNFYHSDDMCLPQSWYVACDIQLYIAALLIIIPLLRWPKIGLAIAGAAVIASMIGSAALTYSMGHPPTMLYVHPDQEDRIEYWSSSYFKPYAHAGPYYLGMLVGYLVVTKPKLHFSLKTRILGWCLAVVCNLSVLYGVWEWNKGRDPSMAETLFYSGCHRVAWSLGIAWVVINCASGQGGVVNYILSWSCWKVLGRLTYAAYLIHPIVQITAVGNIRMKLQPWHYFAVWMFFGHLLITYGCSFAASMLVEAPCLALEKLIFRKKRDREQDNSNTKLTDGILVVLNVKSGAETPLQTEGKPRDSFGGGSFHPPKGICGSSSAKLVFGEEQSKATNCHSGNGVLVYRL